MFTPHLLYLKHTAYFNHEKDWWVMGWLLWNLPIKEPQCITHHVCCRSLQAVYDTWAAIMTRVMVRFLATRGAATCPALVPWLLEAYYGHQHVTTVGSSDYRISVCWWISMRLYMEWLEIWYWDWCLTHFKSWFSYLLYRIIAWSFTEKLLAGDCHRVSPMGNQHCFR